MEFKKFTSCTARAPSPNETFQARFSPEERNRFGPSAMSLSMKSFRQVYRRVSFQSEVLADSGPFDAGMKQSTRAFVTIGKHL
jgi:hypothetical protein